MVKKIIKIILVVLGIGLFLFLILHNIYSFVETTNRLKEILNPLELKNFFEIYNEESKVIYEESIKEITEAIESTIDSFQQTVNKPFEEIFIELVESFFDFGFDFIIYFCNYGLNGLLIAYILLHENITGTQTTIKTSPLAGLYLTISKILTIIKNAIIWAIKWLLNHLYEQRRKIALLLMLYLLSNGVLYKILTEFIIFIITYVIKMINLETYLVVFSILESLFIFLYPKLKYIPSWLWIPLLIIIVFLNAIARATYKLKKNHQRLKEFVNEDLTQTTFINGPPGTGKTLLNVSMTLAAEENYVDELNKKLLEYELKYKYINFAKVRQNPEEFPEHAEYYHLYDFLYNRGTLNISNFSIMSPAFNQRAKIWKFDYMRKNRQQEFPLEEYIVISLSEFDKEYNSHDDKKLVGEDGVHVFFSTVSHELKRHVKVFVDYQLKDQVPLRIRGNAEYFLTIKKREKKIPILLAVYYLPFKLTKKIVCSFIEKYEKRRRSVTKKSLRKGLPCYKRNDLTLPYVILRSLGHTLSKICNWFETFSYFKLKTLLSQEDSLTGIKKNLFINIRDLKFNDSPLYDTTFLSYAYEAKCTHDFRNLRRYQGLQPTPEELKLQGSKFLDMAGFTDTTP